MEMTIKYYGESGTGRVRLHTEKDETVAYIHFGPNDVFKTHEQATEAAKAVIATHNKIEQSKTIKA